MKSEIAVFMAMKRVHGFFNTFSWDCYETDICSASHWWEVGVSERYQEVTEEMLTKCLTLYAKKQMPKTKFAKYCIPKKTCQ